MFNEEWVLEVLKKVVSLPAATKTGNHSFFMQQLSTAQYICLAEKHLLSHANVPFQPWTATTLQKSYYSSLEKYDNCRFLFELTSVVTSAITSSKQLTCLLDPIPLRLLKDVLLLINASSLRMLNLFILIQCVQQAFELAVDLTIVKLKWSHSLRVDSALCCRYLKVLHCFEWYWSNDLE